MVLLGTAAMAAAPARGTLGQGVTVTYLAQDEVTSREMASGFPALWATLSSGGAELIRARRQLVTTRPVPLALGITLLCQHERRLPSSAPLTWNSCAQSCLSISRSELKTQIFFLLF